MSVFHLMIDLTYVLLNFSEFCSILFHLMMNLTCVLLYCSKYRSTLLARGEIMGKKSVESKDSKDAIMS